MKDWQKGDKILLERGIKGQIYREIFEYEATKGGLVLLSRMIDNVKIYSQFEVGVLTVRGAVNLTQEQRVIKERWGI